MRLAAALFLFAAALTAQDRWRQVYHYDQDKSSLVLNGIRFFSPMRGIAFGERVDRNGRPSPTLVVTSDGGKTWTLEPVSDTVLSLFVLDDSVGWMLTTDDLLRTDEAGRQWRKTKKRPKDAVEIHFIDEKRGFAAGFNRSLWRTRDGGDSWQKVPEVDKLQTTKDRTVLSAMDFLGGKLGLVAGWSAPRRLTESRLPPWLDPQAAVDRWQVPGTSILVETKDGGETWMPSVASIFGRVSDVLLSEQGYGFGLMTYDESFKYPSEVMLLDWRTGKSQPSFRDEKTRVTSLALPGRRFPIFAAGVETLGLLSSGVLPGKVVILRSDDAKLWVRMPVDYRATARNVTVTAIDANTAFAVTDSGMILKLERGETK